MRPTSAPLRCFAAGLSFSLTLAATAPAAVAQGHWREPTPDLAAPPASTVAHETVRTVHEILLLAPPPPALVPELWDYYLILSERAATGEVSPGWAAYLYTNYFLDLLRDRPSGVPRRDREELRRVLQQSIEYYNIRKRPEARPAPFGHWVYQVMPTQ
ncbi:MAG: hypothetical protein KatS3mg077_2961 [Candidatus Binatia bacterium]|nr:MAG: hypothetical protein KatS3mg077_2961 [Candidatus Binatia bacterium]